MTENLKDAVQPTEKSATDTRLDVEVLRDRQDLLELQCEWQSLLSSQEFATACSAPEWVLTWIDIFGPALDRQIGFSLRIITVRKNGELIALLPMYRTKRSKSGGSRIVPIGFIGGNDLYPVIEEPTSVFREGLEQVAIEAIIAELTSRAHNREWDLASFQFRLHDGAHEQWRAHLRTRTNSWYFLKQDTFDGSAIADVQGSWEAYRKSFSKKMRDKVTNSQSLLNRSELHWSVRMVESEAEIGDAAQRLIDLHRGRAKSSLLEPHPDYLSGVNQQEFLKRLMQKGTSRSKGLIAEFLVSGQVVASQCFFRDNGALTCWYSGFSDEYRRYSPIFVLQIQVFKAEIEKGIRRINFLRGDAYWKQRWRAESNPDTHWVHLISKDPLSVGHAISFALRTKVSKEVAKRKQLELIKERDAKKLAEGRPDWASH